MSNKFQKGDVVRLNSGGPEMTIQGVHKSKSAAVLKMPQPDGYYDCVWFENTNKQNQDVRRSHFHEDELTLIRQG